MLGSIPTSYLVGKAMKGIDLREHGSGNLGATNAFRVLGWKTGLFVLACDTLKGALPVIFLPGAVLSRGCDLLSVPNLALVIGLATILGHIFTVFMKFKGGKGVAASMGVFIALAPVPFLITLIVCLFIIGITRYVSAGSLAGAIMLPALVIVFHSDRAPLCVFTAVVGILIIIRHRSNIRRLLRGEENKLFP